MSEKKYFNPPFCPNPTCDHASHQSKNLLRPFCYTRKGSAYRSDGSVRLRYVCRSCGKGFCCGSFGINYRLKIRGHVSARVFQGVVHNRSNRSIARELGVSEGLVRHRILRLSRLALLRHNEYLEKSSISEEVAYDGLEAFAGSQYEPNNVNQVVGARSLFCYLFNYAPMNRKGRTSERQRQYLFKLEEERGRFDTRAIREASADIFRELGKRKSPLITKIHLRSDEHFHYRRALAYDLSKSERSLIFHETVSSKECRNYKNILFPVNHLDLLIRRKVAAFSRETICFSKKASRMMHKYVLYIVYKNYMKPQFVKAHKSDGRAHTHSPAMFLGLTTRLLKFHDFFHAFEPNPRVDHLPLDWMALYNDEVNFRRSHKHLKIKCAA